MAQSRLEKIGTIYTRMKTLLDNGALPLSERPLWMDVYEAFPPKYEPRYDRPVLKDTVKPIFYKEDKVRAKFHKDYDKFLQFNMISNEKSKSEIFIEIYNELEKDDIPEDALYEKAVQQFLERHPLVKIVDNLIVHPHEKKVDNVKHEKLMKTETLPSKDNEELKSDTVILKKDDVVYRPIRLNIKSLFKSNENDEKCEEKEETNKIPKEQQNSDIKSE